MIELWFWWLWGHFIIIKIKECWQYGFPWLSLSRCPSLLFIALGKFSWCIQYLHRADECKSLLISQLMRKSPSKKSMYFYFYICIQLVLLVLLVRFARQEVSGRTAAVSLVLSSRICSKQHLAFSPSVSLEFKWCNYTVVILKATKID